MEGINIQQVGHFGNSGRIGTPVPVTTTSYLCSSRLVEQHKGSGKAQSSFGRNIFHADQRSYRGYTGTPGEFSRVLLPSFSCGKRRPGGWRPVIDLSILNQYLVIPHFKMETNRSIRASVSQDMWTTSLDLSDAYFHIPIAPCHRHFLRFAWMGKVYAFKALPFGLAIAPLVFTKIMQAPLGHLHSRGIKVHAYLDDFLVKAGTYQEVSLHTTCVRDTLLSLGFLISWEKSDLTPSQDFIFLGEHFRTLKGIVQPPEEKFNILCQKISVFLTSEALPARHFLQLLGYLNSIAEIVPLGRLHIRPLQWYLKEFWAPASQLWDAMIPILPRLHPHLLWWTQRDHVLSGVPLIPPPPTLTLYTDASCQGWGAFLEGKSVAGIWSPSHQLDHINLLEMRAVLLALQHFRADLRSKSLLIATDNTTVVAYLQKQGGTQSASLYLLCKEILLLCDSLSIRLSVRHIPGKQNILADMLSRSLTPVNTEWELHPSVFHRITLMWFKPMIDLFATCLNNKLPTYMSPIPDPKAYAVDAMSHSWAGMLAYAFPPLCLLSKILLKIRSEVGDCKIILIAPAWSNQSWFPDLLDLSCSLPLSLPARADLLSQNRRRLFHPNPEKLALHAWMLSGKTSLREDFRAKLPRESLVQSGSPLGQFMTLNGQSSVLGVFQGRLIHSQSLPNN